VVNITNLLGVRKDDRLERLPQSCAVASHRMAAIVPLAKARPTANARRASDIAIHDVRVACLLRTGDDRW